MERNRSGRIRLTIELLRTDRGGARRSLHDRLWIRRPNPGRGACLQIVGRLGSGRDHCLDVDIDLLDIVQRNQRDAEFAGQLSGFFGRRHSSHEQTIFNTLAQREDAGRGNAGACCPRRRGNA